MTTTEQQNRESAAELGWSPEWFGLDAEDFGPVLAMEVSNFQVSSLGIVTGEDPEGVCGWATFLRLREWFEDDEDPDPPLHGDAGEIMIDGEPVRTPFAVRSLPIEQDYWRCPTCKGKRYANPGRCGKCERKRRHGVRFVRRTGPPHRAVWHWPVTEVTRSTHRVLTAKGISSNGEVAWDGSFVQFVDFGCRTFHASSTVNNQGLGFDVSLSPTRDTKIKAKQAKLAKLGRPPRPTLEGVTVHGWKPGPFLFYYDDQLVTVAGLMAVLHVYFELSLDWPFDAGPRKFSQQQPQDVVRAARGHMNHSDVWDGKWDSVLGPGTPIASRGTTVLGLAREFVDQGW